MSRQEQTRADKSRQEQTRADKSRQEQTRADKSSEEHTRADKSRQSGLTFMTRLSMRSRKPLGVGVLKRFLSRIT
jgi:hypothetical protein